MNAIVKALFDRPAVSSVEAFGCGDITTGQMKDAIRGWFDLFFQREQTSNEDPSQRLPYTIVNKLTKACFAEYDSALTNAAASGGLNEKTMWLDAARRAIDAQKQDVMQWAMIGGECFIKPVPNKHGSFTYFTVRRDHYNVLGRAPNGEINDALFAEISRISGRYYTLMERRSVDGHGYLTICYKLYVSESQEVLGREVALTSLPQYAELQPEHTYGVPFGGLGLTYVRLPMVNGVDGSHDGTSIYEPAMQLIHNIYTNEKQLCREFELGRSRVMAGSDMLTTVGQNGKNVKLKDDLFVGLDGVTNIPIAVFSPVLRDESFERRKQSYLKSCENVIGLKRGILSDVEAVQRTAKEISSSEGDYSLSIIDLQRMWYDTLRETLRITDLWGQVLNLCTGITIDLDNVLNVSWGNGVLYDADKDWSETLDMVSAGLLKPELALAKKYDLPYSTPEDLQAIREKYMPELTDLMR